MVARFVLCVFFIFLSSCTADIHPKIIDKINSFIYIEAIASVDIKAQKDKEDVKDIKVTFTASGACISKHTALTAGHLCDLESLKESQKLKTDVSIQVTTYDGQKAKAVVRGYIMNDYEDVCMIAFDDIECPNELRIAQKAPKITDEVVTFSAPLGMFMPGNVIYFKGNYIGSDEDGFMLFTLPATNGSSGSPVMNKDLEIISVLDSVMEDFNFISLGTDYNRLQRFLDE